MAIPIVHGDENVELFHPVFRARVEALCADPRMRGLLFVDSGVRTKAEQKFLWDGYQNKLKGVPGFAHFNTAANPDSVVATSWYGLGTRHGSWHMQQPDGHGYACDFAYSRLPADIQKILISVAAEYRLVETVFSPQYEPWHYQMDPADFEWVPEEDDMPITEDDQRAIAAEVVKHMEPTLKKLVEAEMKKMVAAELREMLGTGSETRKILLRTEERVGAGGGGGADTEEVVKKVESTVKETVAVELREMLGEGSRTREILEHADASASEAAEAAKSAVGAVADVLERIPRLIPVGGLVARFDDLKAKLDQVIDNTDGDG
jgi:hypothetical protein